MVRKTKSNIPIASPLPIDVETLIARVAQVVAKEVTEQILANQVSVRGQPREVLTSNDSFQIDMDKIIPIAISSIVEETNIQTIDKEDAVDKDLEKAKSRLAELKKRG